MTSKDMEEIEYDPVWFLSQAMKLCQERRYKSTWLWITFAVFYSRWCTKEEKNRAREYMQNFPDFEYDQGFLEFVKQNHKNHRPDL